MIQQLSVLMILGICSYEDIKMKQIHIGWLAAFAVEGIFYWIFLGERPVIEILLAMFPGLFLLFLSFLTKGGIGEGDGILLMTMGIFLGQSSVLRIFVYALFLSAGYALFLLMIKKKSRKYEMAFVPFLMIAFVGNLFVNG